MNTIIDVEPPVDVISPCTSTGGEVDTPYSCDYVGISEAEYIDLHRQIGYWKSLHLRDTRKITQLEEELQRERALRKDLENQLFGKKSEKNGTAKSEADASPKSTRKRGQQEKAKGHGRTDCPNLPVEEEILDLPADAKICPHCGLELNRCEALDEISEIKEVEVRAHIRRIRRCTYVRGCQCPEMPAIVTAPPPIRLLPRSPYGVSFWVQVILTKYQYGQPTHRLLQDLRDQGLSVSPGTVAGGLQAIAPLFEPIIEALYCRQMGETLFHADETRWWVFVILEDKLGHRWFLWVYRSASVIFYDLDPSRGAAVPGAHFAGLQGQRAIIVCDRYSAYKKLARLSGIILLAFCWVHVRRDFLDAGRSMEELKGWALEWKDRIGTLYHLNALRLEEWQPELPLAQQSAAFQIQHQALAAALEGIHAEALRLAAPEPKPPVAAADTSLSRVVRQEQRKICQSLINHWDGLRLFLDHPAVPMDNNAAENAIRGPVTGRKNYYGSGSLWSAALAASLFTIFQTLILWGIPVRGWLTNYLQACADNGGRPPADITPFLPWSLSKAPRGKPGPPPPVVVDPPDTS